MPTHLIKPTGLGFLLLVVLSLASVPADAVPVSVSLCAKEGTIPADTLPGVSAPPDGVPIWSFVQRPPEYQAPLGGPALTRDPTVAECDALVAQLPGSVISSGVQTPETVPPTIRTVTHGDVVTIHVRNTLLTERISLVIPGQTISNTGQMGAATFGTFTREVPAGGYGWYTFTAQRGTYLYSSSTDHARQVAMGLHGAFIVAHGAGTPVMPVLTQAYNTGISAFAAQATLVLSEIDPNLNLHPNPLTFNMQEYAPTYWLINGKVHPDTATIRASAGQRVLLRYVNASFTHHTMALLGLHQRVIARDAFPLTSASANFAVAETIPAGTTADMITTLCARAAADGSCLPLPTPPATDGTRFPLYNRNMRVTNGSANIPLGGMQTRLCVGPESSCP